MFFHGGPQRRRAHAQARTRRHVHVPRQDMQIQRLDDQRSTHISMSYEAAGKTAKSTLEDFVGL